MLSLKIRGISILSLSFFHAHQCLKMVQLNLYWYHQLLNYWQALLRSDLPFYMVPFTTDNLVFEKPEVSTIYILPKVPLFLCNINTTYMKFLLFYIQNLHCAVSLVFYYYCPGSYCLGLVGGNQVQLVSKLGSWDTNDKFFLAQSKLFSTTKIYQQHNTQNK